MRGNQEDAGSRSPRRFQFSLRTLFGLVAVVALVFAMWAWRGEQGVLEFFLGVAVCVIALGIALRRIGLIAVGILVLIGLYVGVSFSARRTTISTTSGWCFCVVPVKVIDVATNRPISGATVRVLPEQPDVEQAATGPDGQADVEGKLAFFVEQTKTLFGTRRRRWISFSGVWLGVDAPGYASVDVPLWERFGHTWPVPGDPLPRINVEIKQKMD